MKSPNWLFPTGLQVLALAAVAASVCALPGKLRATEPETAHYILKAALDADGQLQADAKIALPHDGSDAITLLLGERFAIERIESVPGYTTRIEKTDKPIKGLQRIRVDFAGAAAPWLRIRYAGPLDPGGSGVKPLTADKLELAADHMWLPLREDLNLRFTVDARFDGIPEDFVVVAQGDAQRLEHGTVQVHRDFGDVDLPLVAARGLQKRQAPGVEVYAADFSAPLVAIFERQAVAATRFLQEWLGPLPRPVRLVVVSRDHTVGYARTGYTVVSDGGEAVRKAAEEAGYPEPGSARHIAHEFAHAWWKNGDPLTEHYWLTESLAEYTAMRYIDAAFGQEEAQRIVARWRVRGEDAGPVLGHGRPTGDQLYRRGPLLLHGLEQRIGREQLDRVLTTLALDPPRETAQFMQALGAVAGPAVAVDFEAELRR